MNKKWSPNGVCNLENNIQLIKIMINEITLVSEFLALIIVCRTENKTLTIF